MNGGSGRGRGRTLALAWLFAIASIWVDAVTPLHAEEDQPMPSPSAEHPSATDRETSLEGWILTGVDATVGGRGRVMASAGYVGGFDSWIVLAEGSLATSAALQLVGGHVYLRPTEHDAAATSVWRAGANWSPLRGRFALDNRLLVERRSTRATVSARFRGRLRLSWAIDDASPVRLFAAVEAFVVDRHGLAERRYQAGFTTPAGRASVEAYWLRGTARL